MNIQALLFIHVAVILGGRPTVPWGQTNGGCNKEVGQAYPSAPPQSNHGSGGYMGAYPPSRCGISDLYHVTAAL